MPLCDCGREASAYVTTNFQMVSDFHDAFGLPVLYKPTLDIAPERLALRLSLITEERRELHDAIADSDLVEVADALADLLYVVYGMGHELGINLDKVFAEVQRSNMTKLGADGRPIIREDGKILKGPHFEQPRIAEVLGLT